MIVWKSKHLFQLYHLQALLNCQEVTALELTSFLTYSPERFSTITHNTIIKTRVGNWILHILDFHSHFLLHLREEYITIAKEEWLIQIQHHTSKFNSREFTTLRVN